jgi:hypothetical protein
MARTTRPSATAPPPMLTAVEVAQLELDLGLGEALVAEAAAEPVTVPVKASVVVKVTPYNSTVSHSIR